jgi:hypothetical protein
MKPGSFNCGGTSPQPKRYLGLLDYFGKDTSVKKLRAVENHSELRKRYNTSYYVLSIHLMEAS